MALAVGATGEAHCRTDKRMSPGFWKEACKERLKVHKKEGRRKGSAEKVG